MDITNRITKRITKRIKRRERIFFIQKVIFGLGTIILILTFLFQYGRLNKMSRELSQIQEDINLLELEKDQLRFDLKPYTKKARIEKYAMNTLAMVKDFEEVHIVDNDTIEIKKEEDKTWFGQLSFYVFSLIYH